MNSGVVWFVVCWWCLPRQFSVRFLSISMPTVTPHPTRSLSLPVGTVRTCLQVACAVYSSKEKWQFGQGQGADEKLGSRIYTDCDPKETPNTKSLKGASCWKNISPSRGSRYDTIYGMIILNKIFMSWLSGFSSSFIRPCLSSKKGFISSVPEILTSVKISSLVVVCF